MTGAETNKKPKQTINRANNYLFLCLQNGSVLAHSFTTCLEWPCAWRSTKVKTSGPLRTFLRICFAWAYAKLSKFCILSCFWKTLFLRISLQFCLWAFHGLFHISTLSLLPWTPIGFVDMQPLWAQPALLFLPAFWVTCINRDWASCFSPLVIFQTL